MFLKFFCISLFAILAVNGSIRGYPEPDDLEVLGLIEDAKEMIKKLAEIITSGVSSAVEKLQDILQDVINHGQSIVKTVTDQLTKLAGEYLEKINELKEAAKKAGIDISECIGEQEEEIKNIPTDMAKNLISCVTNSVNEGKELISGVIDEVKSLANIPIDLLKKLTQCGTGITAIPCIGRVLAEASGKIISVPVEITGQIAKVTKFVLTVKSEIILCGTNQTLLAGQKCANILVDITKCVEEKMNGTSTTSVPTSTTAEPTSTTLEPSTTAEPTSTTAEPSSTTDGPSTTDTVIPRIN